jgi:anti-sigma regulatory factor (Ser/Thr protein kinase)
MPGFDVRQDGAPQTQTLDAGDAMMPLTVHAVSAGVESSREAREFVRQTLYAPLVGEVVVTDAVHIVSELVTNALLHGGCSAAPRTQVKLIAVGAALRIEVYDLSPVAPVLRIQSDGAEHGRGLAIVAALADRWGWEPTSSGKCVWCELAVAPEQTTAQRA